MSFRRQPLARLIVSEKPKAVVTVTDVAQHAGVSVSTAARVLRESSYPVSPELKQRIHRSATKLGYVPNLVARNLRGNRTRSLGLIVGNMRDPYFGQIAGIVTSEAFHRSLLALVANMHRDPELEIAMCRKLWEHRVDGLILAGGGFDQKTHHGKLLDLVNQLQSAGVVVVSLSERRLPVPSFSTDDVEVGGILANHMVELGHVQIGVLAGPPGSYVTRGRLQGVRKVLHKHGLKATLIHAEYTSESGAEATKRLIAANKSLTAIITGSDALAISATSWLKHNKIRVPEDVSILSVGNTDYCELNSPSLSSIDTSIAQCCASAMDYIVSRWDGSEPEAISKFPARIVSRASTRRLHAAQADLA